MRKHFLLIAILLATVVYAAPLPYDETADAHFRPLGGFSSRFPQYLLITIGEIARLH